MGESEGPILPEELGQHIDIRQEVMPEGAAQELGEAAVEQVTEQGVSEMPEAAASEASEDESEGTDTRIADPDLAEDMAYAGNVKRARAAEIRRDVSAEKQFKDDLNAILTDPRYKDNRLRQSLVNVLTGHDRPWIWGKPLGPNTTKWGRKELSGLQARAGDGLDDGTENLDIGYSDKYDPLHSSRNVMSGEYNPEEPFREGDLEEARQLDERAEASEEWVRFLHENPVSDEYREQHPDFQFSWPEMEHLEAIVDRFNGYEWWEREMGVDHLDGSTKASFQATIESIEAALTNLSKATKGREEGLIEEYQTKITDPSTTLGDLQGLNNAMRTRYNEVISAKAAERRQVLSDVKSGRASQTEHAEAQAS